MIFQFQLARWIHKELLNSNLDGFSIGGVIEALHVGGEHCGGVNQEPIIFQLQDGFSVRYQFQVADLLGCWDVLLKQGTKAR
jgi:hypothetical protein